MAERESDFAPFQVTFQISGNADQVDSVRASIADQLQKVVNSGVVADILKFFYSVPIIIVSGKRASAGGGCYIPLRREVWLDAPTLVQPDAVNRVYALHELLHAYHCQELDGGYNNSEVTQFYSEAKDGRYEPFVPADEYMLTSCMEFYAITASTFLHGKIPRPPYTRENIERCHPQYCAWLKQTLLSH